MTKEVIMADDIEAIFGPKAGKHGEERLAARKEETQTSEETSADNE